MLRFFRNIRQSLVTESRFSKYLLYAIGEIILVMIGILLALQVNNWNEERENEKKVRVILSDMTVELESNIKETTRLMRYYEKKDSTIFLYLTNQLTENNFKNKTPNNLFSVITTWTKPFLSDEAWTKLMDMSDVIPQDFKSVVSMSNHLYKISHVKVMVKGDVLAQTNLEYVQHLYENYPWYTPRSSNDGSLEKAIDYYLNSHYHRGKIAWFWTHTSGDQLTFLGEYRQDALEVLNDLRTLLNSPTSFNEEVYFDKEAAENLQGVWRSDRFPEYELVLRYNAGRLLLNYNQDTISRELFYVSDNKLNLFPYIRYEGVDQENWQGNYYIVYYTIIQKNGGLILKDYFSEWHKVTD